MNNAFNMLLNGAATSTITRQLVIMLDLGSEYYWDALSEESALQSTQKKSDL